ncbi:MAG: glycosyltransferase, partial [Lachnospiraceae bacterium]|nr:glycosyltransferase [Lachnospiraceae bacterium]
MENKRKLLSVVIPTYNEEENVKAMTDAVRDIMEKQLPQYDFEIIYIDNHSRDGTKRMLRELCAADRRVKAILNCKNFGQM